MKFRIIILIAISAIVTLSFSFASVNENHTKVKQQPSSSLGDSAPVGGFAFDEK